MSSLKTKFTPGPWVIETYHDSLFKICKPDFKIGDEVSHRLIYDAALISAAPEMYSLIVRLQQELQNVLDNNTQPGAIEFEIEQATKTLKKARGEK